MFIWLSNVKEGASNASLLRAMWQAQWLYKRGKTLRRHAAHTSVQNGALAINPRYPVVEGDSFVRIEELRLSVEAMQGAMGEFEGELRKAGWDHAKNVCKISLSAPMLIVREKLRGRKVVA